MNPAEDFNLMRASECAKRLCITRQGLYRRAELGTFPQPIVIGVVGYIPRQEFEIIVKAYLAGKKRDEMKALVAQLHQAREQNSVPA